jgi:hypothetical protein
MSNRVERPGLDMLHDYFIGDPPLRKDIHSGWKPYIRAFLRAGRYNIAEKTVTSTSNRMHLLGFRTAAADDEAGDQIAQSIMLDNEYDLVSGEVHDHMLSLGDGYTIITPGASTDDIPRITAEDPRQVITAENPVTKQTYAGLKLWRDEWDTADFAHFCMRLGDGTVGSARLVRRGPTIVRDGVFRFNGDEWEVYDADGIPGQGRVPFNVMPFDRFRNRFGVADFERHLDTLDRINDKVFNEWWISKIQAFRQRAVQNLPDTEKVRDSTTGKMVEQEIDYTDMFTASPDEMWRVPGDVEFWESTPVDLTPITSSVTKDLERYASATDLPLNTITPDAAAGSAEGATLMREEHVFKINDRKRRTTRRHASVMSKAFLFMGETERSVVTQIEPIWGPSQTYSLEQKASAASQLRDILPIEAIRSDVLQYPPSELARLRDLDGADLIRQALQAAALPPAQREPATPPRPPAIGA